MTTTIENTPVGPAPVDTYQAGLQIGELRFVHCRACERASFYPRVLCPHCGSTAVVWRVSAGTGVVYASTVITRDSGAYNVALVDLDEGFRLMTTIVDVADPPIGLRVALVTDGGDQTRPTFRSAAGGADAG
jgi:uncharacterized OB-fold protein